MIPRWAIAAFLLACLPGGGGAKAGPEPGTQALPAGELRSGCWELRFLGRVDSGSFCWLESPDLHVRLEISQAATTAAPCCGATAGAPQQLLAPLLRRGGEGWTVVLGAGTVGIIQPWNREWKELANPLVVWVRSLLAGLQHLGPGPVDIAWPEGVRVLTGPPGDRDTRRSWAQGGKRGPGPTGVRLELPAFRPPGAESAALTEGPRQAFRRSMVGRGEGRGGGREIMSLRRLPDLPFGRSENGVGALVLAVTSSRKPGRMILQVCPGLGVNYYFPETFSPMWPLGDLIELAP